MFAVFNAFAQEKGYYGKKTFIEIGANAQIPVFQNIFGQEKGYMNVKGTLNKSYNLYDQTLRGSFSTIVSENAAVGMEVMFRNYYINPQKEPELNRQMLSESGEVTSEYINARVEMMQLQEVVIMPKVTFSNQRGRVPAGLTQDVGIGYSLIRFQNTHPLVEVDSGSVYTAQEISEHFIDTRMEELRGLVFNYGIRMNFPITKGILFYGGVRYQYAMLLGRKDYKDYEYTDNWFSGREIWSRVNQRHQLGIINLGIGFTICI